MVTTTFSRGQVKYPPGKHPNCLKNLKPFQPGNRAASTNPAGSSLLQALKRSLDKPLEKPADDAPVRDHIVYATLKGALDCVPVAFRETWDRTEGKVPGDQVNVNVSVPTFNIAVIDAEAQVLLNKMLAGKRGGEPCQP